MECSDAEAGMVDCGVGTIVWVRRRNGSWWPGKILGPDELSASHLMSPRSGTPVKLLGREDASVDWYNLEKSKRVKPFRCGEFDECIERAEASQGMPPKKREKYARREDAILHALELEKQVLEKKYGKAGNGSSTKLPGKDTSITPGENGSSKKTDACLDDKRKGLSLQSRRADNLNVEDKSLRGLKDLGTGPIPLKYKLSNGSHNKHAIAADGVGKKLLEKRKRSHSQEENMEESVGKRRDRHRPLVQVLQSSAKLPHVQSEGDGNVAVKSGESFDHRDRDRDTLPDPEQVEAPKSFPVSLSEDHNTSGSNEDTETDSSGTESLISDTYHAIAALSDEAEHMEFIPKASSKWQGEDESNSDDESGGVAGDSGDSVATVSKWQLKGKRNNRSLTKRMKAPMNSNSSHWMTTGFKGEDAYVDSFDTDMRSRAFGGYNIINNNIQNWGGTGTGGGLEVSLDEYHGRMLIDVEVGVQTGYQREHVPMISLMSKLNDKAIVGHPIPVEAVEDGSSDIILSQFQSEGYYDDDAALQPWRTARRSAKCRVARPPHLSSGLEEEEEDASFREYYDEDGKASAGSVIRSSKGKKWAAAKKPQRRSTASCSSQKIRTLSSIGGSQQQQQSMDMKAVAGEEGIGMLKPESLPTAVACIPVKLVFSRLHEELVAPRHQ